MKTDFYCQCTLAKGNKVQVAWIPEKFAILGKYLEITGEDGWRVVSLGKKTSRKDIRETDYLHQREASDI